MRKLTFAVDIDGTITEDANGTIHLESLSYLRSLCKMGHNVVFVTGRSSVEGYLLAVFGGTTRLCVGENGGCITFGNHEHELLGTKSDCDAALANLYSQMSGVREKPVFPRMTEVVLERTFNIGKAQAVLEKSGHKVSLTDSQYAFHINSDGIDKGFGLCRAMRMLDAEKRDVIAIGDSATDVPMFAAAHTSVALGNAHEDVRSKASMTVDSKAGEGLMEAMDVLGPMIAGNAS